MVQLEAKPKMFVGLPILSTLFLLIAPVIGFAERLPIRAYTTADGLGSATINRIVRDSKGFLWFCTRGGLSRFDGAQFRNYDEHDGLPLSSINDLLESRTGAYWVATNGGGVCRFDPGAASVSERVQGGSQQSGLGLTIYKVGSEAPTNRINVLCEDRSGRLWAGSDAGLFVLDNPDGGGRFQQVDTSFPENPKGAIGVSCFLTDNNGDLLIGTTTWGLFRRSPDGRIRRYSTAQGLPSNGVFALLRDRSGHLWAGTGEGLYLLAGNLDRQGSIVVRAYSSALFGFKAANLRKHRDGAKTGPARNRGWDDSSVVGALYESSSGQLWIGSFSGLVEFDAGRFTTYNVAAGMSGNIVCSLAEDIDGNLWIGTEAAGAMKLTTGGFTTYTEANSPGLGHIYNILADPNGAVIAASDTWRINRFDGHEFSGVRPRLPPEAWLPTWGGQSVYLDSENRWWVLTDKGLYRFPKVRDVKDLETVHPVAYTARAGMPGDGMFSIHQDQKGDFWVGAFSTSSSSGGLARMELATGKFDRVEDLRYVAPSKVASSFCDDRSGGLWISFYDGGLARYKGGRFEFFTTADGLPEGGIFSLCPGQAGRLWFGTSQAGLGRVDDAEADHPHFAMYTTSEGLASNLVRCIAEDMFGRIYAGTGSGVDRLDPATGVIRHFTTADGLANDYVTSAFRDSQGQMWFGTLNGLSRLIPGPDQAQARRPAFINRLTIAGITYPVSELGQTVLPNLTLEPNQNSIQIEFFGIGFASGDVLRYQYRLMGTGQDWSEPTDIRAINYAALSPGAYRFEVRAVKAGGLVSVDPAVFSFRILPPLWRRWWFMTPSAILAALMFYGVYRFRVARLLEMERVRTRIAADLHDDIGSSLSQIAVLSEVLRKQLSPDDKAFSKTLSVMARVSRSAVDSMGDIVWAINPQKDHLLNLSQRMRRFASEVFPASNIEFHFSAPPPDTELRLGADVRREVFLIFKEPVNNIVRHSGCTLAEIELRVQRSFLVLTLSDDGTGFDPTVAVEGNGLVSMRRRAASLGGQLEIESHNGGGTTVTLKIPQRANYVNR